MNVNPGYETLANVLQRALDQAQDGKGAERHANQLPFDQQPMQTIARAHGVGFLTGQASKKAEESHGLPAGRDVAELLGAINYLAGAVIFLEGQRVPTPANDNAEGSPEKLEAMRTKSSAAEHGKFMMVCAQCGKHNPTMLHCLTGCRNG